MDGQIQITDKVLEKINMHTVKPLTADEVYCFSVILCDNEIDRDFEKFSVKSLETLAPLYIGRTGIFDHNPKGENQSSRIYDTIVKEYEGETTCDGEVYTALIGYAYMVRTQDNKSLIAEIDGGIKKEVSVSCKVTSKICSVCGCDEMVNPCVHQGGKFYGERLCYKILEKPDDAYEWSFVAVPCQRNAGVTKKYDEAQRQQVIISQPDEHKKLEKACENLKSEILKLSYFTKPFRSAKSVSQLTEDMDFYELLRLKKSLEKEAVQSKDTDNFITEVYDDNNDNYKM